MKEYWKEKELFCQDGVRVGMEKIRILSNEEDCYHIRISLRRRNLIIITVIDGGPIFQVWTQLWESEAKGMFKSLHQILKRQGNSPPLSGLINISSLILKHNAQIILSLIYFLSIYKDRKRSLLELEGIIKSHCMSNETLLLIHTNLENRCDRMKEKVITALNPDKYNFRLIYKAAGKLDYGLERKIEALKAVCGLYVYTHSTYYNSSAYQNGKETDDNNAYRRKNYYKILGVKDTEPLEVIKNAYRKLAKRYHPDRNPGNKAYEEKFKEIAEAWGVIRDPAEREKMMEYPVKTGAAVRWGRKKTAAVPI